MLVYALAATLVGLSLLVAAIVTGNVWLAVAAIATSVIGLVLLIVDIFQVRNRSAAATDSAVLALNTQESTQELADPDRQEIAE